MGLFHPVATQVVPLARSHDFSHERGPTVDCQGKSICYFMCSSRRVDHTHYSTGSQVLLPSLFPTG